MPKISNQIIYGLDNTISPNDSWIGTDAQDFKKSKTILAGNLLGYIMENYGGTEQNNFVTEKALGVIDESVADALIDAINGLDAYTVSANEIAIFTGEFLGDTYNKKFVYILSAGKGTYGTGGTALALTDIVLLNPVQEEAERNTTIINNIISQENKILQGSVIGTDEPLEFQATPFVFIIGGQTFTNTTPLITLDEPDGGETDPRIDVIAVDSRGTDLVVIKGTPSPSPQEPTVEFGYQLRATAIQVEANADTNVIPEEGDTPVAVTTTQIYDENTGDPSEFDIDTLSGTGDSAFTLDPQKGTLCIFLPDNYNLLEMSSPTPIVGSDSAVLSFQLKTVSTWSANSFITIKLQNNSGGKRTFNLPKHRIAKYGFDHKVYTWQTVVIPVSDIPSTEPFATDPFEYDDFVFESTDCPDLYLDDIKFQSGIGGAVRYVAIERTSELINDGEFSTGRFIEEVEANTFYNANLIIKGLELDEAGLAAYFSFNDTDVGSIFVINGDTYAIITNTSYIVNASSFSGDTTITGIIETAGYLIDSSGSSSFQNCTSLAEVSLAGFTGLVGTSTFMDCSALKPSKINLPNLVNIGTNCFRSIASEPDYTWVFNKVETCGSGFVNNINNFKFTKDVVFTTNAFFDVTGTIDIRNTTALGDPAVNNGIFTSIDATSTIIADYSLSVINAGSPDEDLVYAISEGATVEYVNAPTVELKTPSDIRVIPDSVLPSTTQDVVVECKDMTSDSTVSFGAGVTLNSQSVELNKFGSFVVRANVTLDATEQAIDVIVNNGLIGTGVGLLNVVNGTVYIPVSAEYTDISGDIDISTQGEINTAVYGAAGSAKWIYNIDSSNFELKFSPRRSPLATGDDASITTDYINLTDTLTGDVLQIQMAVYDDRTQVAYTWNDAYVKNTVITDTLEHDFTLAYDGVSFRTKYDLEIYESVTTQTIQGSLLFTTRVQWIDKKNIKYINLETAEAGDPYDDNYATVGDNVSLFVNDGEDGTSRYVQESEISNFVLMPPYLSELFPDTYLPSTTGNFILRGSFFTSDMVITIEGHTINYQTFVSSNEFLVNLTTSATEGDYDVTLNNGLEVTFSDVLQVVNGTVYQPTSLDWINITEPINFSIGSALTEIVDSIGTATWNREIDITGDFSIQFKCSISPLDSVPEGGSTTYPFEILDVIDDSEIWRFSTFNYSNFALRRGSDNASVATLESSSSYIGKLYELKYISNIWYVYENSVLVYTAVDNNSYPNNIRVRVSVRNIDITDIKYIDLSDASGGYTDYSKLISQFINDAGYLTTNDLPINTQIAYIGYDGADDSTAELGRIDKSWATLDAAFRDVYIADFFNIQFRINDNQTTNSPVTYTIDTQLPVYKGNWEIYCLGNIIIDLNSITQTSLFTSTNPPGGRYNISFHLPNGKLLNTGNTRVIGGEDWEVHWNIKEIELGIGEECFNGGAGQYMHGPIETFTTDQSSLVNGIIIGDVEIFNYVANTNESGVCSGAEGEYVIHRISGTGNVSLGSSLQQIRIGDVDGSAFTNHLRIYNRGAFFMNSTIDLGTYGIYTTGTTFSGRIKTTFKFQTPANTGNTIYFEDFSGDASDGTFFDFNNGGISMINTYLKISDKLMHAHTFEQSGNTYPLIVINSTIDQVTPTALVTGLSAASTIIAKGLSTNAPSIHSVATIINDHSNISQFNNDAGYITEGKRIVDATVTTTYDLDHALASDWKLTMTGDTTFTESNLPTGDNTTEFTIKLTGAFTPTFPAYWDVLGDAYDGAVWNFIAVQIHDGNSGTEEVTAFITNM